jgi:nucleotide-binding universal stress UspA family protein
MKRILIATDGSDHALKAAEFAGKLAAGMNAELHVLAVAYRDRANERELREFARIENLGGGIADVARNVAESHAEQARRRAEAQGAKAIKTSVIEGDPTEEILAYITAQSIDAVVVGRRGRSSLARLLLGSVSHKLASLAPCIVIICP